MVPEDELVTFQGQRVCAEGKAILLERLQAGEGLPGEFKRPTVLRRFGCIFLDGLIVVLPLAILTGIVAGTSGSMQIGGAISLLAVCVEIVYFGQMHASGGQTVGKKAGKLKVVNLDGSAISTKTAYVRAVAYIGPGDLDGPGDHCRLGAADWNRQRSGRALCAGEHPCGAVRLEAAACAA